MKQNNKLWFTLVELLVVITILAIISVVAYQNFWWAVDKAVWGRKISDVSTIEAALQQYKSDSNYYPNVDELNSTTNLWWYTWATLASASNKIQVTYNGEEILSLNTTSSIWWWKVYWSGTLSTVQIGAKWTISRDTLWKKYLSKDLYDPELWDIKVWTAKMIDNWIWRYVYWVYKKWTSWDWPTNKTWTNYNIAYTIKKDWTDTYVTKIVWDFDKESCYDDNINCPDSLIWTSTSFLIDWQEIWKTNTWATITTFNSYSDLQWIPYAVTDFAQ